MKILVIGAKGQLGTDVVEKLSGGYETIGVEKEALDITNLEGTINTVRDIKPDVIINTAAYTNVDGAETEVDLAYKVNCIGAKNLAIATMETGCRLVHISTDFVFDGQKSSPYIEFDPSNPLSIYGKSKLAGEISIKEICHRHYILRTSWLYGEHGHNFVKTMLKLSETNRTLRVVDDQIGSPTYTKDLVAVIEKIITTDAYGTYHASNEGECSWNAFAKKIFEVAGVKDIQVSPITSEELNRPAIRPKYSVMKNYMLQLQLDYKMPHWEEGLKNFNNKK
ncbi:dTDP-4-dehydrorhamnose reductase [Clostridium formicaceticum]|uniref:dTDP-4-dehydrorhamnose reductase n=1 Tax=Clostridium formicaceticum TaxID=1497 RepID=A0AAC9RKC8_9CLOT|nr:dTDP-4-dehydrorhamnose reductase [Clostridium formicaceticum]AOY78259.1 dTDP-4-dehydrorhamnose reductase [Clostridium formicaceticum]ARE85835.1 dTDP-4-dehydrorhamnose reductase [Clostridium formicaceticum]